MQLQHYNYNTTTYIGRFGTFGNRIGVTRINTCPVTFLRNATFAARRNKIPPRRGCQTTRVKQNLEKKKFLGFVVDVDGTL